MRLWIKYLSFVLIMSSFFRIVPIITGLIYGEPIFTFILGFLVSFVLGILIFVFNNKSKYLDDTLSLPKGLMLITVSFLIIPAIGCISYLSTMEFNLIDALFESFSGFTTTGLTIYSSLDNLPKSLLIWRAETQWMGGIGIVMFFLFMLSRLRSHTLSNISEMESSSKSTVALYQAQGFPEKIEPGLKKSTNKIIFIYVGFTVLGIIFLMMFGMSLFESISLSFSSISTGGFAVSDNFSFNNSQLIILSLLMIAGSISFVTHNKLLQRKFKEFFRDYEKNIFLILVLVGCLISLISLFDLKIVFFNVVSAFTTTGFATSEISLLPQLLVFILMIGMVIGGNVGSTSGGLKVFRVSLLIKSIPWLIKKLSFPSNAIIPFKFNKKPVEENNLLMVGIYVFMYIGILIFGTIIFMAMGYGFFDSSFQMTSALGTVGLQTLDLSIMNGFGKIILMIAMLLGRLEIFPLLILLRNIFIKR